MDTQGRLSSFPFRNDSRTRMSYSVEYCFFAVSRQPFPSFSRGLSQSASATIGQLRELELDWVPAESGCGRGRGRGRTL